MDARQRERKYKRSVSKHIADMTDEELLGRWRTDFATHNEEVNTVFLNRLVFEQLHESLVASKGSGIVSAYLKRSYVATQSIAIRRLVDRNPQGLSLQNTLTEMLLRRKALTRQAFIEAAPRSIAIDVAQASEVEAYSRQEASEEFDRQVGPGARFVHKRVLQRAINDLADLDRMKRAVDTQFAHSDRSPTDPITWHELNTAIDALEKHLNSIALLLTGSYFAPSEFTIIGDWGARFHGDPSISG